MWATHDELQRKKEKKFAWNVSKRKQLLTFGTVFLGNVTMVPLAANL